jgi:hypothetical protein
MKLKSLPLHLLLAISQHYAGSYASESVPICTDERGARTIARTGSMMRDQSCALATVCMGTV